MSNPSMIATRTRTAVPCIETLHGKASSAIPGQSSTLQPFALLKELYSAFKNALSGILYPVRSFIGVLSFSYIHH